MCPCCRRDFVLDPYDLEDEDMDLMATGLSLFTPTVGLSPAEDGSSLGEEMESPPAAPTGDVLPTAQEAAFVMAMEDEVSSSSLYSSRREVEEEQPETAAA